eukprot:TRINITY_DN122460_c0_g1_i1.p1 TRINITY_DN122460_c0_g1~~TRINITY_DN122460_c0_g1_i1.p1  ORF type:complete len:296 (-),score=63.36 TRINITY_DN122460_c0_g1_i1:30-917(-)
MRVLAGRLLSVLEGSDSVADAGRSRHLSHQAAQQRQSRFGSSNSTLGRQGENARATGQAAAPRSKDGDNEESTAFDLLHQERGFMAFEQWYKRVLASAAAAHGNPHAALHEQQAAALAPPFWPQVYCPPNLLHEYAFLELLRTFTECSDSEAFDLFDLLDCEFLGMLGLHEVYIAICLLAAHGSRQLTKFLYFHSTRLFGILSRGCKVTSAPEHVSWPRLVTFLRLLGTPGHLISRASTENGVSPLAQLNYEQFLEVLFPIAMQLDRGSAEFGESTVINECDRSGHVRSRLCTLL